MILNIVEIVKYAKENGLDVIFTDPEKELKKVTETISSVPKNANINPFIIEK